MTVPKVACAICGKMYVNIASHLTRTHKMTKVEYVGVYPDADLNTEYLSELARRGAVACYEKHYKDNPEACKARVANVDWAARNAVKRDTYRREGIGERQAAKMREHFKDPDYVKKHVRLTTEAMARPEVKAALRAGLDAMTPEQKASWRANLSQAALNMTPEKRARITKERLLSSKVGSKKERAFYKLLCEEWPEAEWRLHNFIRTDDPLGKSGLRQIDIMSAKLKIYIEWNGYLHYINPWGDVEHLSNMQRVDVWKQETVARLGGTYIGIKDWDLVISPEDALELVREVLEIFNL